MLFSDLPLVLLWSMWISVSFAEAQRGRAAAFQLELVNGGYENLLIGISEKVSTDPELIDRIKTVFTDTSKLLYATTNNRVYFKEIHILLPASWNVSPEYENVTWQHYDQSDVIIDTPSGISGSRPYTFKPTPCGEPGFYIHLTPDYLRGNAATRDVRYDKTLVHEWAHYRWGVFDEYPLGRGQHFYAASNGNIEAVRCVLDIPGSQVNSKRSQRCNIGEDGYPEADCRFIDDREATGFTGSLMYRHYLPQLTTFCQTSGNAVAQGNVHNIEAPNLHNIQCRYKSVWEIMLQHRDFAPIKGESNAENTKPGGSGGVPGPPNFTIVQRKPDRLVLVLDVSGSMRGRRLQLLRQASKHLIENTLNDGCMLGIVQFNETADVLSDLLTINDQNRKVLLDSIPAVANGGTSIGAGIIDGIKVLNGGVPGNEKGGRLLVITDGEENRPPCIDSLNDTLKEACVVIDTIAFGMMASESLERVSLITGGRAFYSNEETNSLSDYFSISSTSDKDVTLNSVPVYTDSVKIQAGNQFSEFAHIDMTVGSRTRFIFDYSTSGSITVNITDPKGNVQTDGYVDDIAFKQIQVAIPGIAMTGYWKFLVQNNNLTSEVTVAIRVESYSPDGVDPIVVRTNWHLNTVVPPEKQSLYVTVAQGNAPVLYSNVTAHVDTPCGSLRNQTVTLIPKDDGVGADIIEGDGVYSSYFTQFCGKGRYGVSVEVNSNGEVTKISLNSIIGVGAAVDPLDTVEPTLQSTGKFTRVSLGESFKCEGDELCSGTTDIYAPARITDLTASNVDMESMEITLRFTAPGDDLSTGNASYYIIVMSRNFSAVLNDFDSVDEIPEDSYIMGDVNRTKEAREVEVFVIKIATVGDFSFAFAVVAVDDEDNQSEPSNIATSSARDFRAFPLGLVIGLAVGGVLLLIIFISLSVCLARKVNHSKSDLSPASPESDQHVPTMPKPYRHDPATSGKQKPEDKQNPDSEPHYSDVISHRRSDPNWDPSLQNNSQGGGAHIRTGHVSDAVNMFDNSGYQNA